MYLIFGKRRKKWIKNIAFRGTLHRKGQNAQRNCPPRIRQANLYSDPDGQKVFEILFASFFTVLRFINTTARVGGEGRRVMRRGG